MSERDDEFSADQVFAALLIAVFLIVLMVIVIDRKNVSELRDLQRRVGQLEQTNAR